MKEKKPTLLFLALIPIIAINVLLLGRQDPAAGTVVSDDQKPVNRVVVTATSPIIQKTPTPVQTRNPIEIPIISRSTLQPVKTTMSRPVEPNVVNHTVKENETLTSIASQYSVSIDAILEVNNLVDPNSLFIGQALYIPLTADQARQLQAISGETLNIASGAKNYSVTQVGMSANGYAIESYTIGNGRYHVAVIGAMHGGYEWNTAILAYRLLAYFTTYAEKLPADVTLHIIPIANPDGTVAVTGVEGPFTSLHIPGDTTAGRFNGNQVDLNRNWDCQWSETGIWRDNPVSGGDEPFSESETQALQRYIMNGSLDVVVWLHSAAGLVVPGQCGDAIHEPSQKAADLFGEAAGYPVGGFTAYEVSGDAANWLALNDIASFTVELSDHEQIEFDRNLSGLLSLINNVETIRG